MSSSVQFEPDFNMDEKVAEAIRSSDALQVVIAQKVVTQLLESNASFQIAVNTSSTSAPAAPALNKRLPGIVGLMGFGTSTVLLNAINVGQYPLGTVMASMALFYGGFAQVVVGILEYFNNNNFGFVAFFSYGIFWMTLYGLWMFKTSATEDVLPSRSTPGLVATYLTLWGVFSCGLLVCTFKKNLMLVFLFTTVVLLFFTLAITDYLESEGWEKAAGVIGIICGSIAMYISVAELIENQFGREYLPLFKFPLRKKAD